MVNAVIYGMVLSMLISIPPLMEVAYPDFSLLSVSEQIEAFLAIIQPLLIVFITT